MNLEVRKSMRGIVRIPVLVLLFTFTYFPLLGQEEIPNESQNEELEGIGEGEQLEGGGGVEVVLPPTP